MAATDTPGMIVLFDGECGMCNASVRFIIRHDASKRFQFASQQSPAGQAMLQAHGISGGNSVVVIEGDRVYIASAAVLRIVVELDSPLPILGLLIHLPMHWRDSIYNWVARNRKWIFPANKGCPAPTEEEKSRFLKEPPLAPPDDNAATCHQ